MDDPGPGEPTHDDAGAFRAFVARVLDHPTMFVGSVDLAHLGAFLDGADGALHALRPDLQDEGLAGFREWLAVRLDSCVRSAWWRIIAREDVGPDKLNALRRLHDEFERDRRERGLAAILDDYRRLVRAASNGERHRACWCESFAQAEAGR